MRAELKLALFIILLAACLSDYTISECQSQEELREMLTMAFEAVARAEGEGGDVSMLVDELNQALSLIEAGAATDMAEAQSVIEDVLSAAPVIEQQGIASTRIGQVKAGVIVSLLAVSAVVVWRFGPRVFWSTWLRSKRGWRVMS